MAIAIRATGTPLASGLRSTSTVPMPAGLAAGDEVRIVVNAGMDGATAPTIALGSGNPAQLVATVTWGDGTYTVRHSAYRYRYVGSGDPASFSFTHQNATSDGVAAAYSGVDATTPDDAAAVTTSIANTGPAGYIAILNGITTVTAGAMLVVARGSWDGLPITPPAGWTERVDQPITWLGDQIKATAGATGNIEIPAGSNAGVAPGSGIVMALRPASGVSPVSGAIASVFPGFTQSAQGVVTAPARTGVAASVFPAFTQSAQGETQVPVFSGQAASAFPAFTQQATGEYDPPVFSGEIASVFPAFTQQALGEGVPPQFVAVAASVFPAFTQQAEGVVENPQGRTGQIASVFPAFTQAAEGAVEPPPGVVGEITSTFPALTQQADGTVEMPARTGEIASTFPALVQSAAGTTKPPGRTGEIHSVFPAFTQHATGGGEVTECWPDDVDVAATRPRYAVTAMRPQYAVRAERQC